MRRRLRIHRFREPRSWLPPLAYGAFACVLGVEAPHFGAEHFGLSAMSPASALAALSSVASGMMALTAILFSLLFVGLQFGAMAYSPRLVSEFFRQRLLPHALGVFTGTFLYSLLAIRAVNMSGTSGFNTVVTGVAFLWVIASVVLLARLFPGIQSLSITNVLPTIGERAREQIRRVYPLRAANEPDAPLARELELPVTQVIHSVGRPLYVQAFDVAALVREARRTGGIVRIPHAVGDQVSPGAPLAFVLGGGTSVPDKRIRRAIVLGRYRTIEQDPAQALRLLVDIGIRALSPAINDPTTAVTALDEIETLLQLLGSAKLDVGSVMDEDGVLRVVHDCPSWGDFLTLALTEIEHYGRDSVQVERRLGALLFGLEARLPERRRVVLRQFIARWRAGVQATFSSEEERAEAVTLDRQGLGHAGSVRSH